MLRCGGTARVASSPVLSRPILPSLGRPEQPPCPGTRAAGGCQVSAGTEAVSPAPGPALCPALTGGTWGLATGLCQGHCFSWWLLYGKESWRFESYLALTASEASHTSGLSFFLLRGSHDPVCGCANQQKKLVCVYIHAQLLTKGVSILLPSVGSQAAGRELDCIEPETLVGAGKLAWPLLSGSSKRKLGAG